MGRSRTRMRSGLNYTIAPRSSSSATTGRFATSSSAWASGVSSATPRSSTTDRSQGAAEPGELRHDQGIAELELPAPLPADGRWGSDAGWCQGRPATGRETARAPRTRLLKMR